MADEDMPPKPETFYKFDFPTGVDASDANSDDDQGDTNDHNADDEPLTGSKPLAYADSCHDHDDSDEGQAQVPKASKQSGKALTKSKKSPRRDEFDQDEDPAPKPKKSRPSLFGGPVQSVEHVHDEDDDDQELADQDLLSHTPITPGFGIRDGLHTLHLEPEEDEKSPSECSFNFGLGPASDGDDLSPRASPAPSEESFVIPPDDRPAYDLRQNIERRKAFTYIDTDKSGNFDPAAEARERIVKRMKSRAAKAAKKGKKKLDKKEPPKEHVLKCIVRLRFEAYGNVRNQTNDAEDNWPDDWSVVSSDYEREMEEIRSSRRRNTPGRDIQVPIPDPAGEFDDLTGHPVARGCKICHTTEGEICSMIGGDSYPCGQCVEEGTTCEPLISPTKKFSCAQCAKDGKEYCSFQDDPDQVVCDDCVRQQTECIPLPPNGYKVRPLDLDEILYKNREFKTCTNCRRGGIKCSLKKKKDDPPCKHCKKNNLGCTFEKLQKPKEKKKPSRKGKERMQTPEEENEQPLPRSGPRRSEYFTVEDLIDLSDDSEPETYTRASTPEQEMTDNFGRTGMLTKIKTAFAHPIEFNAEGPDCNFCELPTFGMTGHSEREVYVIRYHDGSGYGEVAAGFYEEMGSTRICETCTVARLQTLVCEHDIHPLPDAASFAQDFDEAVNELLSTEPSSEDLQNQLKRWCSMCFSLATHGCFLPQPDLCGEEESTIIGCGLRFCDSCTIRWKEEFVGNVDIMATEMEKLPKPDLDDEDGELEGKARADVGFLRRSGLLMKSMERDA